MKMIQMRVNDDLKDRYVALAESLNLTQAQLLAWLVAKHEKHDLKPMMKPGGML